MSNYTLSFHKKDKDETLFSCGTAITLPIKAEDGTVLCDGQAMLVSYSKRVYEPCRIDACIKLTSLNTSVMTIRDNFLARVCDMNSIYSDTDTVAKNYFVYEATPEVRFEGGVRHTYITLAIYSMDKLLDMVEECHSYVGQKLCTSILPDAVTRYTAGTGMTITVNNDIGNLQFLKGSNGTEYIQPYLVQYNETFYSMLARTANRCGEFLFFEDGALRIGMAYISGDAISDYKKTSYTSVPKTGASIFKDHTLYTRDYVKDTSLYNEEKSINLHNIQQNLVSIIETDNSLKNNEDAKKLSKLLKEIADMNDSYKAVLLKVSMYQQILAVIKQQDDRLCADDMSKTDISQYLTSADYDNLEKCKAAIKQISEDIVNAKIKLTDFAQNSLLQSEAMNHIEELNRKEFKLNLYKKRAESIDALKNIGSRYWNGNQAEYATVEDLQEGWNSYLSSKKDDIDGCIKKAEGTNLPEEIKHIFDDLKSSFGINKQNVNANENNNGSNDKPIKDDSPGISSSATFIYDYDVPVDEYQTLYTKDPYADKSFADYSQQMYVILGTFYKVLNKPGSVISAAAEATANLFIEYNDYLLKRKYANEGYNNHFDKVTPHTDTTSEYEVDTNTKHLYSSIDSTESSAILSNIIHKGLSVIRLCEERHAENIITIEIDTANNKQQLKLGSKILFDGKEYIVTEAYGSYDSDKTESPYTETIKAVPVLEIGTIPFNIPPMIPSGHVRYAEPQTAKVVDNWDPELLGRVRVRYSWQEQETEDIFKEGTPYIRVGTTFASKIGGVFFNPAVNDEVMIDYDHGNIERPFVSCSLYNGATKAPLGPDRSAPAKRVIATPNGHQLVFSDISDWAFLGGMISKFPPLKTWLATGAGNYSEDTGKSCGGGISLKHVHGMYNITASSDSRAISFSSPIGSITTSAFTAIDVKAPHGDINIYGKNVTFLARNNVEVQSGMALRLNTSFLGNSEAFNEVVTGLIKDYTIDLTIVRSVVERIIEPVGGSIKGVSATDTTKFEGLKMPRPWDEVLRDGYWGNMFGLGTPDNMLHPRAPWDTRDNSRDRLRLARSLNDMRGANYRGKYTNQNIEREDQFTKWLGKDSRRLEDRYGWAGSYYNERNNKAFGNQDPQAWV